VHAAATGEEALEVYGQQSGSIDLMLLDLGMPGIGREQLLKKIRAMERGARVVVISGCTEEAEVEKVKQIGAAGFVAKPFGAHALLKAVRAALDA